MAGKLPGPTGDCRPQGHKKQCLHTLQRCDDFTLPAYLFDVCFSAVSFYFLTRNALSFFLQKKKRIKFICQSYQYISKPHWSVVLEYFFSDFDPQEWGKILNYQCSCMRLIMVIFHCAWTWETIRNNLSLKLFLKITCKHGFISGISMLFH